MNASRGTTQCTWCGSARKGRKDGRFCGKRCRQSAWRMSKRSAMPGAVQGHNGPGRFAYADPPYPGRAKLYYGREDTYAGEVDHVGLIQRLNAGGYDGWALSTSADAIPWVVLCVLEAEGIDVPRPLPPFREWNNLLPRGYRWASWSKPGVAPAATYGMHNMWEPLLVCGGRRRQPGVPDRLHAYPARGGGSLMGRKPISFCAWLFDLLGMLPGDDLDDLFPGTGVVGRAWAEMSARHASPTAATTGPPQRRLFTSPTGHLPMTGAPTVADTRCDASPRARSDASLTTSRRVVRDDASPSTSATRLRVPRDASLLAAGDASLPAPATGRAPQHDASSVSRATGDASPLDQRQEAVV